MKSQVWKHFEISDGDSSLVICKIYNTRISRGSFKCSTSYNTSNMYILSIYIDDLSNELALCKSGCYITEQCMNHVIYADDICFLAPSAIGLQQMLDVCFNFSICNDIIFNPVKSVCIAFRPKKNKLFCPNVTLDNNVLEYIGRTKYLGFMFNSNGQDDEELLRQMRNLYIRSNKLLRTFHYCSSDVKLELFKSYCTSFY